MPAPAGELEPLRGVNLVEDNALEPWAGLLVATVCCQAWSTDQCVGLWTALGGATGLRYDLHETRAPFDTCPCGQQLLAPKSAGGSCETEILGTSDSPCSSFEVDPSDRRAVNKPKRARDSLDGVR